MSGTRESRPKEPNNSQIDSGKRLSVHYAWVITLTGTLVLLLSHGFGRLSYSVILPSMRDGLSLTYTQVGLIGTGNFIGYLALAVTGGFVAARFGTRRTIFVALLVMSVSLFCTGLANSFSSAFVARLITGTGNGGSFVPMMALPAVWFSAKKRGLAVGIVNIGAGTGLSIAGLILPYCIACYGPDGWRYAWYLMAISVFVCSFVCYALLRDTPEEKGLRMYGDGEAQQAPSTRVTFFSALDRIARDREIWKLAGVYFMYGFSYIIYVTFFVAYLTKEVGLAGAEAGRIFALIGLCGIFCGVLWGAVSDYLGRKYALLIIFLIQALACVIFSFYKQSVAFYMCAALFGMTAFSIPVIIVAATGDAIGGRLAPAALGFITLFFGIGQAFAPFVGGWIKDVSGTFAYAFTLSAAVSLIGAFLSLFLRKRAS